MKVRCYYCDEKGKKSLDKKKQDYIKKSNKNYHTECFRKMRLEKGKTNKEIDLEIETLKQKMIEHEKEKELRNKPKNDLCNWLMDYYNVDVLPSGYFHRLASITKGKHTRLKVAISYEELLEIYQYMANYLNKVAMKKKGGFDSANGRLYWDLAIVINNYNDYKNWKSKQKQTDVEKEKIDDMIKHDIKVKQKQKKKETDDFDIIEDLNDLLL